MKEEMLKSENGIWHVSRDTCICTLWSYKLFSTFMMNQFALSLVFTVGVIVVVVCCGPTIFL